MLEAGLTTTTTTTTKRPRGPVVEPSLQGEELQYRGGRHAVHTMQSSMKSSASKSSGRKYCDASVESQLTTGGAAGRWSQTETLLSTQLSQQPAVARPASSTSTMAASHYVHNCIH